MQQAAVKGRPDVRRQPALFREYVKNLDLVLLFLPIVLYYLIFHYAPMYGIIIAFKDFKVVKGLMASPWVGFQNFIELFVTPSFWQVFRNTVIISLLKLVTGFPAPILLALLLNEIASSGYKKLVQTVSYLPHFLSWVVLAGIFLQFLSPSAGFVNQIIKNLGFKPVYFLGDPVWFRSVVTVTHVWQSVGWGTIIYLAAISSINPELYEASVVDGSTRFQQMRYITLPSLTPVITIMTILSMGHVIDAGFDQVFNLYNPAVYEVGDILDTYVYRRGLENMQYSFASAVGLFKNVISFAMIFIANILAKRINEYGIW